jgi:hypothetical protein
MSAQKTTPIWKNHFYLVHPKTKTRLTPFRPSVNLGADERNAKSILPDPRSVKKTAAHPKAISNQHRSHVLARHGSRRRQSFPAA